jgi:hypothetical protein
LPLASAYWQAVFFLSRHGHLDPRDSATAGSSTLAAFGWSLALGSNQTVMVIGNETLGALHYAK